MNRGRARQVVFHDEQYYQAFLKTLCDVKQRFHCVIHAYCLMGNHYHLLLQTPNANLSRIMRHINGVYTQRYNRLGITDGPLFRGRYKTILVDSDAYLLQLSRYIHRNPIDMRNPMVSCLEAYTWSSYLAYIGKAKW
ncbi:MAG: transposase [Candidatus Thiodiazotropha sp. (ex Ustalcina ferruginea)]|nr:transposase [Candidatus Thiodiazotropha sp. (ex Ustalcina ferruginea)]